MIMESSKKDPAKATHECMRARARLARSPRPPPWTPERAEHCGASTRRASVVAAVAEVLLSHEAEPPRVIRQARS